MLPFYGFFLLTFCFFVDQTGAELSLAERSLLGRGIHEQQLTDNNGGDTGDSAVVDVWEHQEQFSKLNFDATDMMDQTEAQAEEERLNNSFWGRLYLDGFPGRSGIQYFRAHFGAKPPSRHLMFVLADPLDNCNNDNNQTLTSPHLHANETILVAKRGSCSFAEKAQIARDKGAAGVIFVNNEEGNMFPSAQGTTRMSDVNLSVTMIGKHHGERLIQSLQKSASNLPIMGKFIPIACDSNNSNYCNPVTEQDELYIDKFFARHLTGTISFSETCRSMTISQQQQTNHEVKGDGETKSHYNYAQAEFGMRIEHGETFTIVRESLLNNFDFCNENSIDIDNVMNTNIDSSVRAAVLVHRGNCSFLTKAQNVASTGASMIIVVNHSHNHDDEYGGSRNSEIAMGIDNDYEGSKVHIAAIMISKDSWEQFQDCNVSTVTFHPTRN